MLKFSGPQLMAILNVTPDSFYSGSRKFYERAIADRVGQIVREGADIVDVGGYSSRPGADEITAEEETRRVMLGVEAVRREAPGLIVSVDTFRSEVARKVLEKYGPDIIINDISASEMDPAMADTVAEFGGAYIAMHMRGTPSTMQRLTEYEDVAAEVRDYLQKRAEWLRSRGVAEIILDPGFGFAKTAAQNYRLLAGLQDIKELGYPVLAGMSRKSMVYRPLGITPEEALPGTLALHWEAMRQGADILRVHDVAEARQTIDVYKLYRQYGQPE